MTPEEVEKLAALSEGEEDGMLWHDIAIAISTVLKRNSLQAPEIGNLNRFAMKLVLRGLLALEKKT